MDNTQTVTFSGTPGSKTILKNNLLLLAIVTAIFFLNFYNKTMFYRPISIHQWRQTDCLSMTKNYYEEGMNFFQPKIHWQGVKDGKTVSECPILNYSVACLWKVFGEHEFIYRLLEYIIFITSIFLLFNTILRFFKSPLLAFFITGIFLTSPLLAYYSLNFIADVPALSFGIICFCLFFTFYNTKSQRYFYWALFFGTLAVLLKASALIGLSMLLFFSFIDVFNLTRLFKTERLFKKKLMPVVAIVFSIGLIFAWYRYALYYNNFNSNNVFLLTVLPIWEMDEESLVYNLKLLFNVLFPVFLNKPMFFLFFCFVLYVAANFKKLSSFFKYSFVFSGLFFVFYILFFFQVFSVHDYYLNNLMIFPVITFLCFSHIASQSTFVADNKAFIRLVLVFFLLFNAFYSAAFYRLRMIEDDKLAAWFPFISREEKDLAKYMFWEYGKSIKLLEHITPDLRKAGIKRDDFVLAVPDISFDVSLYMMDQKGFVIARNDFEADTGIVKRKFTNKNIKYLVISDTLVKRETVYKKMQPNLDLLFSKGHVEVYKLKSPI